ncbi:MAG: hypothetical protein Q9M28_09000 [Mariprofundaceae bacterium]|nr:hypothetical protein [Mariprofundaceae bacterium]
MIQYFSEEKQNAWQLIRRDVQLGWWLEEKRPQNATMQQMIAGWQQSDAVHCPNILNENLHLFTKEIAQAIRLVQAILKKEAILDHLDQEPYLSQLQANYFEPLISSLNEGDSQEIEKITFDVLDKKGDLVTENLWVKFAWLSLHEKDDSIRARFSFGLEGYEDVAADPQRETLAASICHSIFPESALLTKNKVLNTFIESISKKDKPEFVECIAYFNAPNGGALFHHDMEKGHEGAIFAQLSGHTAWLGLSKEALIQHILNFVQQHPSIKTLSSTQLQQLQQADAKRLDVWLDEDEREALDILINETPAFIQQLTQAGHAFILHPGDVILLPQKNQQACAWHTVVGLGDEISHALSFAVN